MRDALGRVIKIFSADGAPLDGALFRGVQNRLQRKVKAGALPPNTSSVFEFTDAVVKVRASDTSLTAIVLAPSVYPTKRDHKAPFVSWGFYVDRVVYGAYLSEDTAFDRLIDTILYQAWMSTPQAAKAYEAAFRRALIEYLRHRFRDAVMDTPSIYRIALDMEDTAVKDAVVSHLWQLENSNVYEWNPNDPESIADSLIAEVGYSVLIAHARNATKDGYLPSIYTTFSFLSQPGVAERVLLYVPASVAVSVVGITLSDVSAIPVVDADSGWYSRTGRHKHLRHGGVAPVWAYTRSVDVSSIGGVVGGADGGGGEGGGAFLSASVVYDVMVAGVPLQGTTDVLGIASDIKAIYGRCVGDVVAFVFGDTGVVTRDVGEGSHTCTLQAVAYWPGGLTNLGLLRNPSYLLSKQIGIQKVRVFTSYDDAPWYKPLWYGAGRVVCGVGGMVGHEVRHFAAAVDTDIPVQHAFVDLETSDAFDQVHHVGPYGVLKYIVDHKDTLALIGLSGVDAITPTKLSGYALPASVTFRKINSGTVIADGQPAFYDATAMHATYRKRLEFGVSLSASFSSTLHTLIGGVDVEVYDAELEASATVWAPIVAPRTSMGEGDISKLIPDFYYTHVHSYRYYGSPSSKPCGGLGMYASKLDVSYSIPTQNNISHAHVPMSGRVAGALQVEFDVQVVNTPFTCTAVDAIVGGMGDPVYAYCTVSPYAFGAYNSLLNGYAIHGFNAVSAAANFFSNTPEYDVSGSIRIPSTASVTLRTLDIVKIEIRHDGATAAITDGVVVGGAAIDTGRTLQVSGHDSPVVSFTSNLQPVMRRPRADEFVYEVFYTEKGFEYDAVAETYYDHYVIRYDDGDDGAGESVYDAGRVEDYFSTPVKLTYNPDGATPLRGYYSVVITEEVRTPYLRGGLIGATYSPTPDMDERRILDPLPLSPSMLHFDALQGHVNRGAFGDFRTKSVYIAGEDSDVTVPIDHPLLVSEFRTAGVDVSLSGEESALTTIATIRHTRQGYVAGKPTPTLVGVGTIPAEDRAYLGDLVGDTSDYWPSYTHKGFDVYRGAHYLLVDGLDLGVYATAENPFCFMDYTRLYTSTDSDDIRRYESSAYEVFAIQVGVSSSALGGAYPGVRDYIIRGRENWNTYTASLIHNTMLGRGLLSGPVSRATITGLNLPLSPYFIASTNGGTMINAGPGAVPVVIRAIDGVGDVAVPYRAFVPKTAVELVDCFNNGTELEMVRSFPVEGAFFKVYSVCSAPNETVSLSEASNLYLHNMVVDAIREEIEQVGYTVELYRARPAFLRVAWVHAVLESTVNPYTSDGAPKLHVLDVCSKPVAGAIPFYIHRVYCGYYGVYSHAFYPITADPNARGGISFNAAFGSGTNFGVPQSAAAFIINYPPAYWDPFELRSYV